MGLLSYKVKVVCGNCGAVSLIKIPNGTTILEYLKNKNAKCSYCKCNSLNQYFKVSGESKSNN